MCDAEECPNINGGPEVVLTVVQIDNATFLLCQECVRLCLQICPICKKKEYSFEHKDICIDCINSSLNVVVEPTNERKKQRFN